MFQSAYEPVAAYIRWRAAGQTHLADDVQQETWLLAARKVANFDPTRASFVRWVCGLAANVMRNHLRSQLRHQRRYAPLTGTESAPDETEHAERVALALSELPERQEAVLRAKYLDQASVQEIARDWSETPKAIESLLSRAREAFRELYARQNETHHE